MPMAPDGGQRMHGQGMLGMQGGMMGHMPMMGTMIMVIPMPMDGGMMGQMPMMKGDGHGQMMGDMPMMKGMDMGGMMGGKNAPEAAARRAPGPRRPQPTQSVTKTGTAGRHRSQNDAARPDQCPGQDLDFIVDLNATGIDLGFDLSKQATLIVGDHNMPATAWEVALDHGHHVNGVLKFPAHMQGAIESASGPDRPRRWPGPEADLAASQVSQVQTQRSQKTPSLA